jgi:PAS domain S-box-containing protein
MGPPVEGAPSGQGSWTSWFGPPAPRTPSRILVALLIPVLAALAQWFLWDHLRPLIWFAFYPAVFLSAWIGGLRGALASAALSAYLAVFCFVPPALHFPKANGAFLPSVILFLAMGALFGWFHDRLARIERENLALLEADRRRDQAALESQEALLQRVSRLAKVGGWAFDAATGKGEWTEEVARIHDLDPSAPASVAEGLSYYTSESRPVIERAVREAVELAQPYDLELEILSAKGVRKWVRTQAEPVVENGHVVRVHGSLQDITARKQAEAALQEGEERLRLFFAHSTAALAMFDREMRYLAVSQRWMRDYGLTGQELLGKTHYEVFPEITEEWKAVHRRGLAGEVVRMEEDRFLRQDGTIQWLRWEVRPWFSSAGPVGGIIIFTEDITERVQSLEALRQSEAALRASQALFATIVRSNPMGIGVSRLSDSRLVEVNETLAEIFGLPREEMLGRTTLELGFFMDPEDRQRMMGIFNREQRVRNFQFQHRRRDGEVRDVLMSGERVQLGGTDCLLGMASDITSLKATERALQASESRFRSLFENLVEGFAHCRLIVEDGLPSDFEYLSVNPAFEQLTGLTGVVGRRVTEVIPGFRLDSQELLDRYAEVVRTGRPARFETFLPSLGIWFWVSAYRAGDGEFVAVFDNITERKRAEEALRVSQARFLAIFRASPVGILLSRLEDGSIIDANPAFLERMGFRQEEVVDRTSLDLGIWADPRDREAALERLRAEGRLQAMEADLRTSTGEVVAATWATELVELDGATVMVNLIQDVTEQRKAEAERRQLEAEVAHAQKLESLGALAGGVSHDMNNVLSAIMALGSLLKETRKEDSTLTKYMDTLIHAAGRGRDLVKGLTDFARKDIPDPRPMDLNEVVRQEAALLNRATLQKVVVDLQLQEGLPAILGDAGSIGNVIMNLCVNAMDAMPNGGRIILGTSLAADGGVLLDVRDTGQGMPPEVLQRAMEPFFTTKPQGRGTGLGLARVYGIMKSHGGRVEMKSEPGRGTEIRLIFPRYSQEEARDEGLPQGEARGARSLQILLVDDDQLVRQTVPVMIETLGHQVVTVSGGPEALDRMFAGFRPDLVILDLSMPSMDGKETLQRLRLIDPKLPVILCTGYRDERQTRILERFPDVALLMKPFMLQDLKARLAKMELDGLLPAAASSRSARPAPDCG